MDPNIDIGKSFKQNKDTWPKSGLYLKIYKERCERLAMKYEDGIDSE